MDVREVYNDEDAKDDDFLSVMHTEDGVSLAPFRPTPTASVCQALQMAGVSGTDVMLDLGSGDGRFCVAAAQLYGVQRAIGVEMEPELCQLAHEKAEECGVAKQTCFQTADIHQYLASPQGQLELAQVTVLVMYLLPAAEDQLTPHIHAVYDRGGTIISVMFDMGGALGLELAMHTGHIWIYKKPSP